jgi:hypothetical protein
MAGKHPVKDALHAGPFGTTRIGGFADFTVAARYLEPI